MGNNKQNCHYLKPAKWASGELCFWRNNPNYSDKTKAKLEKLNEAFCAWEEKIRPKYRNEF